MTFFYIFWGTVVIAVLSCIGGLIGDKQKKDLEAQRHAEIVEVLKAKK
jgi:hypothetical protein